MKKLLSLAMSMLMVGCVSACSLDGVKVALGLAYDYGKVELEIKERDCFAPCYFNEFFHGNEHTKEYFYLLLNSMKFHKDGGIIVTIDGEEWSMIDRVLNKLPVGIYDIIIETKEGLTMPEIAEDGFMMEFPYQKKITVPVSVSSLFEDKYTIVL